MPSLQGESAVAGPGSPMRRNRLSLKFFQKKETKRALDFSEPPPPAAVAAAEPEQAKPPEEEESDQVVPNVPPHSTSPGILPPCEKKDSLVPFVGLNNLGNTCYLNSILQVLYYCPRLREGVKKLHNLCKTEDAEETLPMYIELIGSFNSLISSMEQLLTNFLLNPTTFSEGELATPPRKILHTLRQLNPMYDGYLQHDAQEVLQCILGYMQEACDNIRKQKEPERTPDSDPQSEPKTDVPEDEAQPSGKRKSDTELGNAKKKPKSTKKSESDNKMMTRSKRKSSVDASPEANKEEEEEDEDDEEKEASKENIEKDGVGEQKRRKKKKAKLGWLRPSGKQPSIFSKFLSVGKITSAVKVKQEEKHDQVTGKKSCPEESADNKKVPKPKDDLDLMEHLFQGQLVLRTRCLECECFTERREDFQDISVPVLDEEPSSPDDLSEARLSSVSPDPKPEVKTLNWALGQFASVERLVGEDKYFCETCCHYTEAERSLLFDKTPEVVTIHLKRFSASSSQLDPYGGLSKVNTPLQTPLTLSLDEWCTPTSTTKGHQYQLFAVVMHSGVTISCGHYTAFVRVRNLNDVKLHLKERREAESEEETKEEATHYDDGEVSLRQRDDSFMKKGTKKTSEGGVGLLGGQRSFSGCDVGHSKLMESAEGSRRRRTFRLGLNSESGVKTEPEEGAVAEKEPTERAGGEATEQEAIKILQEYEGKWLLFDDSEVRLFEEAEFMQACSPDTFSSSTPYLLFYSRTPEAEAGK
ncbi:ubiquitin carboxyl-terminal hydrolase 1 isoform 2-T4 [Synchiropus picturatus]